MKSIHLAVLASLVPAITLAADAPNFSGRWAFDAKQSQNVGMMAMAEVTLTIKQSDGQLVEDDHAVFGGKSSDDHIVYDLSGKPVKNTTGMSGSGMTTSGWSDQRLVTEWQSQGRSRTETRSLSADGKTMFIESQSGDRPKTVMAYSRIP
jgi:hypothetical protein